MKIVFWMSLIYILYVYAGYPCLLLIWSKCFPKKNQKKLLMPEPEVSVVIAAYNEEKYIAGRIDNLLKQNYPLNQMEIIIVSDGSTDETDAIVRKYINPKSDQGYASYPKLHLIRLEENKGKAAAVNTGVTHAASDYIIFTDARQQFDSNAIRELIANFHDPSVGCVTGELVFFKKRDASIREEITFYWDIEKWIRKMEGEIHSVAGATGAIYAIRKSLYKQVPEGTLLDDVFTPMNAVLKGYRTVFEPKALAYDSVSKTYHQEKQRKIRTLLGNYQLLESMPLLLHPSKNPIFFRYLSHKVFRLFVPFFYLILIAVSLGVNEPIYNLFFGCAMLPFFLTIINPYVREFPYLGKISKISYTFISLNYFALLAFIYYMVPVRKRIW